MKKLILLILALFLMTGCIDYSSKVHVKPDGSGTIEENVLISRVVIDMMSSFAQSFDDSSETVTGFELFDEEELISQAIKMGEGVSYVWGEKIQAGGKEGYKAVFTFKDISKLKLSETPEDKLPAGGLSDEVDPAEEEYITFNFTKGNPAMLEIELPRDSMEIGNDEPVDVNEEDSSQVGEAWAEQAKMFLKGLRIEMSVDFEGDIQETNATYREQNQITLFEMNFDQLLESPEKFDELKKVQPQSMEEIKELMKDIPGFKFELNNKVFVKFN